MIAQAAKLTALTAQNQDGITVQKQDGTGQDGTGRDGTRQDRTGQDIDFVYIPKTTLCNRKQDLYNASLRNARKGKNCDLEDVLRWSALQPAVCRCMLPW